MDTKKLSPWIYQLACHAGSDSNTATGETYILQNDRETGDVFAICGPIADDDYCDKDGAIRDDWMSLGWHIEQEDAEWANTQRWTVIRDSDE